MEQKKFKLVFFKDLAWVAGSVEGTGSVKNYFGHAENVELRVDGFKEKYDLSSFDVWSLPGGASLDLKLTAPRLQGTRATLEADVHRHQRNLEKWSSYVEQRTGFSTSLIWSAPPFATA